MPYQDNIPTNTSIMHSPTSPSTSAQITPDTYNTTTNLRSKTSKLPSVHTRHKLNLSDINRHAKARGITYSNPTSNMSGTLTRSASMQDLSPRSSTKYGLRPLPERRGITGTTPDPASEGSKPRWKL